MFKKILLAVDLNEARDCSRAADAAKLIITSGSEFHIVNVVPDTGMAIVSAALGPGHDAQIRADALAQLVAFAKDTYPDLPEENLHVVQGTIYDQIIKIANKIDADTIVVGANRPDLKDYLVGPNAARVVRHAKQSVFVVR